MKKAIAAAGRRQARRRDDLVQLLVQFRKHRSIPAERPRSSPQLLEHRRTFDPVEHERIRRDLQDARHGIPVPVRVLHHQSLPLGIAAGPKPAEDAPVGEIEDLRGASGGDELHRPILKGVLDSRP